MIFDMLSEGSLIVCGNELKFRCNCIGKCKCMDRITGKFKDDNNDDKDSSNNNEQQKTNAVFSIGIPFLLDNKLLDIIHDVYGQQGG